MMTSTVIILHNIRSAYNVGSIFRTADAAGVSKIFLTGYTPAPQDKFGRWRGDIGKVALGAEKTISWEKGEIFEVIKNLKKGRYELVAVEQDKNSINYKDLEIEDKQVFVFGSETEGLSKEILDKSDVVVEIPMKGEKESLNVSVTTGIILFK